jgi:hypothetical protein
MCKLSSYSEKHIRVSSSFMIAPRLGTVEMIILMGIISMWNVSTDFYFSFILFVNHYFTGMDILLGKKFFY